MKKLQSYSSDMVVLKGLHCQGKVSYFKNKCDRYCNLLWKAAWL